ncbi:4-carboxymuconolactone decarboxylase [Baekduia soli]|uniref:4-carboxymuconolactone decarboxylase n=1 Tax=Baekduia soli TaxID=496014 RepID=A0A5B8UBZ2_9ACTN|nr:4-carboxymuconolactone decarboxylase [Baekduia soli]QEC50507.1 4-carboxymuconolactone decarboxylase [Baekduia soli]
MNDDQTYATGEKIRREVLGDEHVDRSVGTATPLTEPWVRFMTGHAWGSVWSREGLDRRTRSAVTLGVLVALGHEAELALHLRGARNNGMTVDEIREALMHASVYAGVPAANAAFAVAKRVLAEDEGAAPAGG